LGCGFGGKMEGFVVGFSKVPMSPGVLLQDCKEETTDICNTHTMTDTDWDYVSQGDQMK
jgi:hypothetical protein